MVRGCGKGRRARLGTMAIDTQTRNHTLGLDSVPCCMDNMKFRQRHHKSLSAASYHRHELNQALCTDWVFVSEDALCQISRYAVPLVHVHGSLQRQGEYVCMDMIFAHIGWLKFALFIRKRHCL